MSKTKQRVASREANMEGLRAFVRTPRIMEDRRHSPDKGGLNIWEAIALQNLHEARLFPSNYAIYEDGTYRLDEVLIEPDEVFAPVDDDEVGGAEYEEWESHSNDIPF